MWSDVVRHDKDRCGRIVDGGGTLFEFERTQKQPVILLELFSCWYRSRSQQSAHLSNFLCPLAFDSPHPDIGVFNSGRHTRASCEIRLYRSKYVRTYVCVHKTRKTKTNKR